LLNTTSIPDVLVSIALEKKLISDKLLSLKISSKGVVSILLPLTSKAVPVISAPNTILSFTEIL
jgi:hypothetical protein